jgi:DNA-binding GntR family transcriptional regulator
VNSVARQWGPIGDGETVGARHLPLRDAVLAALRDAIIAGEYGPGTRLPEEEIAGRYDVSRNPIREALHALAVEGFVVIEPRRGARVATIDGRRANELFELRGPLEGLVARFGAQRRTASQLAELRAVVDRGHEAVEAERLDELPGLNTRFHAALASAADNEMLAGTLGRMSDIIRWVYASRISERSAQSWAEHAAIVEAVAEGDPDEAERRGLEHIANAGAAYMAADGGSGDGHSWFR